MAEQIIDGTGAGYRAKVGSDNQLHVVAATIPYQHHVAHIHKQAYRAVAQQTPSAANKAFFYIDNDNSTDLVIWKINFRCAAADAFEVWSVTGTAVGTALTPSNAVVGSGMLANATCVVGNDITGLTKNKLLCRVWVEAGKTFVDEFMAAITLLQHNAIAVYAVTGTAQSDLCMTFDFHSPE